MNFHLAIPSRDLNESRDFYKSLGAIVGREYPTHVVLQFHECQLVLHQSDHWARKVTMYPRHFGIIAPTRRWFDQMWNDCWIKFKDSDVIFERYFIRHEEEEAEHHTFFLKDPSNNLIEFKWYKNRTSIFG